MSSAFAAALAKADVTQDEWSRLVFAARQAGGDAAATSGVPTCMSAPQLPSLVPDVQLEATKQPPPPRPRRHTIEYMPHVTQERRHEHVLHAHSSTAFLALDVDEEESGEQRPQWGSQIEYLLSVVGFAVGLGNVWRFPMLAMRNGGGAFLVPYLLALVLVGIPLFVLELCVGQVFQVSASRVWGKFDKRLTGVGWGAALTAFNVAVYYNVIIAWTLYYLVASFRSPLPWTRANSAACMPTSSESFLPASDYWESCVTQHVALSESGWLAPNWPLTVALVTAWVMAWGALHNGIESSGKVVLFTATFPYVVLVILFFRGVTLEGASEGIMYYVTPDFSKLGNMQVWASATTQIFFSLGPGFGTHIGYASYVPKDTKFLRDGLCIGLINSATSVFAGFVVFSVLGHLAHVSGVPVSELALSGPGLAFIAYPTALALLPGAHVFAVLFFLMVISLAIDSQMGQLEVGISAFVERGWRIFQGKRLGQGIAVVCAVGLVIGLSCTTRGGVEMVAIFDGYSCLISVYVTCFCQLFAIIHIHGISGFVSLVRDETGTQLPRWLTAAWTYVTMPLCAVLGTMSVVSAFRRDASSEAPLWTTILGWLIGLSPIVVTVIVGYIAWRNAQRRLQSGVAGSKSKLNGKHLNGGVLL